MLLRGSLSASPKTLARLLALSRSSSPLIPRPLCARQALCSSRARRRNTMQPPGQASRPTPTAATSRTVCAPFATGTIGRSPGAISERVWRASQARVRFCRQLTLCACSEARFPSSRVTGQRQAVRRPHALCAAWNRRWGYGGGWRRLGDQRRQRRRAWQRPLDASLDALIDAFKPSRGK